MTLQDWKEFLNEVRALRSSQRANAAKPGLDRATRVKIEQLEDRVDLWIEVIGASLATAVVMERGAV